MSTPQNAPVKTTATNRTCQCVSTCGDDPNVQARLVRGCERFRAKRNPELLVAKVVTLRDTIKKLVTLLDRMEPEVPEADRASDDEWIAAKADANRVLTETE